MYQTIYFQKETWELFKDEPNKSATINKLLAEHYGVGAIPETIAEVPILINTPEQARQAVEQLKQGKSVKDIKIKLCRHGNALGACLDKGADRRCRE